MPRIGDRIKRLRRYGSNAVRIAVSIFILLASAAVALHHWFPEPLSWLPSEIRAAIAIAVFGFLANRILLLHQKASSTPCSIHRTRDVAYDQLLTLVKQYGASDIDLLQFSGDTALRFLEEVAKLEQPVSVRIFVVDEKQARQYDSDWGTEWHTNRAQRTIDKLRQIARDRTNFKYKAFRYSTNSELSAIVIDDFYGSIGWYRSYIDPDKPRGILRIRGHDTPAVNVIAPEGKMLLDFARTQIRFVESASTLVETPVAP